MDLHKLENVIVLLVVLLQASAGEFLKNDHYYAKVGYDPT